MRTTCLLCLLTVSLAATPPAVLGQKAPPAGAEDAKQRSPAQESILKGKLYLNRGLRKEALNAYEEATNRAQSLPENDGAASEQKAAALLENGKAYLKLPEGSDAADDRDAIEKAKVVLQDVVKIGTPAQTAQAYVFLANAAMKEQRPQEALEYLNQCKPEQFEARQRFALSYNKARAYEGIGEVPKAIGSYLSALELNPHFLQAAERAADLAARTAENDPTQLTFTGDALLARGYSDQAQTLARTVIHKSTASAREDAAVRAAVALLLRALAVRFTLPDERVQQLKDDLVRAGVPEAADDVREILEEPIEVHVWVLLERGRHPQLSDFWFAYPEDKADSGLLKSWSTFVTAVAGWFAGSPLDDNQVPTGDPRDAERALALFLVAWGADRSNSRAGSGLITLLKAESQRSLYDRYFTQLEDVLYSGKNAAYEESPSTPDDWLTLLQYHVVLGSLFEDRGEIGSPQQNRSALGQLHLAVRAERKVMQLTEGRFTGSAPLYARLAMCLQRAEDPRGAVDAWITSAERSLAAEDLQAADESIRAAEELPMDAEQRTRLQQLREQLTQ